MVNYSDPFDSYGITREYTTQSADTDTSVVVWQKSGGDRNATGSRLIQKRSVPTQAEADAIKRQL